MDESFFHTTLGKTGMKVHRLGLSAIFWPGKKTIHRALDAGINYFFGAEQDIFPHLSQHNPVIVSFTATRWRYLIGRAHGWRKEEPVPTAGMCYRFVLSHPNVHVCMTAPSNLKQFEENLGAIKSGPLDQEEMDYMRKFGDTVHHTKKWFM